MTSTFEEGCMYAYSDTFVNSNGERVTEVKLLCFVGFCESFPDLHGSSPAAIFRDSEGKNLAFNPSTFRDFKRAFGSDEFEDLE
jgi:hypothetical protein